jgi:hypothetical protein
MVLGKLDIYNIEEWNKISVSHPVENQLKIDQRSEFKTWAIETTTGKLRGSTRRYRHKQWLSEYDSKSLGNNAESWQMGSHQIKKPLHSKGNNYQSEKVAYRNERKSL